MYFNCMIIGNDIYDIFGTIYFKDMKKWNN